ncbi:MAG: hypothetical protein GY788_12310 [bacterium]|nr:hypothetical protein [bacterium]
MKYAESMIRSIDWSNAQVLRGSGSDLANALTQFIGCDEPAKMSDLWWGLEGVMFAQNTIYGAAEPAVDVLMAALVDDRPQIVKAWIVEVLRFVLTGGSLEDDPELGARCRERARRGTWLLVAMSTELEDADRETVLELLEVLDQGVASVARDGLAAGEGDSA